MSRSSNATLRTSLRRFGLPAIALISFVWALVENRYREAGSNPQSGLDAGGMPFATIPTSWFAGVGCLVFASFLFAALRRGLTAGLCGSVAFILLLLLRFQSFWPD